MHSAHSLCGKTPAECSRSRSSSSAAAVEPRRAGSLSQRTTLGVSVSICAFAIDCGCSPIAAQDDAHPRRPNRNPRRPHAARARLTQARRRSDDGEPLVRPHARRSLKAVDPRIDGLTGHESNPDTTGSPVKVVSRRRSIRASSTPIPNHDFAPVNQQIFNGGAAPTMQGFIASYFDQQRDVKHSRKIMYYFKPDKLPVLTTLAAEYAVFNRWFASIPGPDALQPRVRALRHVVRPRRHGALLRQPEVQEHLRTADRGRAHREDLLLRSAQLHDGDREPPAEPAAVLRHLPRSSSTTAKPATLPDYCFIEPNYSDHDGRRRRDVIASDQHPDHHVARGRAVHRDGLQRDPAEPGAVGDHGAPHHLRRARRHLRPRAAARVHAGRLRRAAEGHRRRTSHSASTAWASACPRSWSRRGSPRGTVVGRPRFRARVDSRDGRRSGCSRTSTRRSDHRASGLPKRFSICCRSPRCGWTACLAARQPPAIARV